MTADDASEAVTALWEKLARQAAAKAEVHSEDGELREAIEAALMAEACFWRATGQEDCAKVEDFAPLPKEPAHG